ncbi:hypothetical protein FQA39_LY17069 [Lamprigera yunnana]|nr:hypothetical protein FQA39_LY17069 [Lamprigera yunnana]
MLFLPEALQFLSSWTWSKFYSPLPHYTYHMTLYNIYSYDREPLPIIRNWLEAENRKILPDDFLPKSVLKDQHILATTAIKKHLTGIKLKIYNVSLEISSVIKAIVELEPVDDAIMQSLRKYLSEIYEYPDSNLKYHITLGIMHLTVLSSIFFVTTAFIVMVFAQQNYTPDPYGQQRYNNQDTYYNPQYNDQQRSNNQNYYPQDRYNNPQDRYNQDRYNSQDRYNQDRDRYNTDRYNTDRDRYNTDRDRDRYNTDRDKYNPDRDRYNTDRDKYNQDRYNQDKYGSRSPSGPGQSAYGQGGNYDSRGTGGGLTDDFCCEDFCYRREESYLQFGTKTAYQFIVKQRQNDQFHVPRCQPVQFWSLNNHGTRLPSVSAIQRMRNLNNIRQQILINYEQRQTYPRTGKMCEEDLDLFRKWRWNDTITEDKAFMLTSQGVEDLKFLARKYQTRFRPFLDQPYTEEYYKFQYSDTERAHDSYQAFVEGLFPHSMYRIHAEVRPDDTLLKVFLNNIITAAIVKKDDQQTLAEYYKFMQKQEYKELVRDVSRRLGFKYNLNESLVEDMYDMCRYEKAWYPRDLSPWCAAFNVKQLKLLEYGEDLKYYYKYGYGNPSNLRAGCPLLKDLFDKFEQTVNGGYGNQKVIAYFSHTSSLQLFLVALGVAKDYTPLTADSYIGQNRRHWRTSNLSPFAGNIVAALYQCQAGEEYKVMFFLNESPLEVEGCPVGLCDWNVFREKVNNLNCNSYDCRSTANRLNLVVIYKTIFILLLWKLLS